MAIVSADGITMAHHTVMVATFPVLKAIKFDQVIIPEATEADIEIITSLAYGDGRYSLAV
jgi:hypothetical protein